MIQEELEMLPENVVCITVIEPVLISDGEKELEIEIKIEFKIDASRGFNNIDFHDCFVRSIQ